MANYSLVIDSKFSPFTFQELLQPALMATQAHQELENQYGELATKANIWEEMANEQTDPYAYKMYKTYARDLESQARQLAREGLTPASRQNMLKMKQRYSSDIIPIEQAYKRRQELIDEQRKLQAQDNTLMFDRSASMMSLDDLIKNPKLTYQSYSGAALAKQVSDAAKSLSKAIRDNPGNWRSILKNQYFERIIQKGYRPEEIIQAIQNNLNDSPILQSIVEDVVGSSGISKWRDKDTLNRAYKYARQGLWDAVGETRYETLANKGITNSTGKDKDLKPNLFAPRVIEGAQGKVSEDLKVLDGLRITPDGYSTISLDRLRENVNKAQKEYDDAEKNIDKAKVDAYESSVQRQQKQAGNNSYAQLGAAMGSSVGVPTGYKNYKNKKAKLKEAEDAYQAEVNKLAELEKKYAHLGSDAYNSLKIGLLLDTIQQKQESSSFALNSKNSDYNNIRDGIVNVLSTIPKDVINAGAVGLVDSNNKPVSYSSLDTILKDSKNIFFKVKGGENTELKLVYGGKEYSIKGIEQLDKYNKSLKVVNDYLKDFSSKIKDSITPISYETYSEIARNGISNVTITDVNLKPIAGTSYIGTVLYNADTGDYIKVLMDNDGNIVAANSLSSELSGGAERDSYFISMANKGLYGLQELFAKED